MLEGSGLDSGSARTPTTTCDHTDYLQLRTPGTESTGTMVDRGLGLDSVDPPGLRS